MIVAIDGPAGAGKSSTAKRVARALNFWYLDTGAMYRAVALFLLKREVEPTDEQARAVLPEMQLSMGYTDGKLSVGLNGDDVTEAIRAHEVSAQASKVAQLSAVRERLVEEQRRLAAKAREQGSGVVVEGRDIGTVVFPDAEAKFFFQADPVIRAERRKNELEAKGKSVDLQQLVADIKQRDRQDAERSHSPLRKADDAIVLDTSTMTLEEQVNTVVGWVNERANT